jgi:S-adenosylmethionine:tRNA ribosyltransferase-isomerase
VTALASVPSLLDLAMGAEAHEPPEARGDRRDSVRLLVTRGADEPIHAHFTDLPRFLAPGDLLVINTSATLPAAVDAESGDGTPLRIHVSSPLPANLWLVEVRRPQGAASAPMSCDLRGVTLALPDDGAVEFLQRYMGSVRLWVASLRLPDRVSEYLQRWGRPIRYPYVTEEWPIDAYQTVYATEPGSAEMPSAGRPFSAEVITALVARGIDLAPLTLHTGVSSLEGDEEPYPEPFVVPADTARRVNETRAAGGRVIAVGTTVVRALESVAETSGTVHPGSGWTDLVVTPERGVRAFDGLVTGFHDPVASHVRLLCAFADPRVLENAYGAARDLGYRWHEFGDSHLIVRAHD